MNGSHLLSVRASNYLATRRNARSFARPWLQKRGEQHRAADLVQTRACHCLAARRAARAITRLFEEHLRPYGLRATQFSALSVLAQRGPTTISVLADILGLERTTMTRGAALLERNGWIDTAPSEDARERPLRITDDGLRTLRSALPAWETAQAIVDAWPGVTDGITEWNLVQPSPPSASTAGTNPEQN